MNEIPNDDDWAAIAADADYLPGQGGDNITIVDRRWQAAYERANAYISYLTKMYNTAIKAHAEEEERADKLEEELKELKKWYNELLDEHATNVPDWIPEYKDGKIINLPNYEHNN